VASLRTGIVNSRTVVKLPGPADPMIVLDTDPPRTGDTAIGATVVVVATVEGGAGTQFRFVKNGFGVEEPVDVVEDPQTFTLELSPDDSGTQRVRAEVLDEDGTPRTLTSYVWLKQAPPQAGCGCRSTATGTPALLAWVIAALALKRARPKPRSRTRRPLAAETPGSQENQPFACRS
jgi:MYXO-CTERM domain-containing protein